MGAEVALVLMVDRCGGNSCKSIHIITPNKKLNSGKHS